MVGATDFAVTFDSPPRAGTLDKRGLACLRGFEIQLAVFPGRQPRYAGMVRVVAFPRSRQAVGPL